MKRIGIFLVLLLLLSIPLTGCDAESLVEQGSGFLNQILGGDPDTPRMSVETTSNSTQTQKDSQPQKGSYDPQEDPEPVSQEPANLPVGVEPTIPSPVATDPAPSATQPPATSAPPTASSGTVTPSHTDATFFGPGESFRYLPKGADGVYSCTYASQDESVAKVDPDTGKVTAVGPGTTKVTMHLEYNGQYDFECIVRCKWAEDGKQSDTPAKPAESTSPADSLISDTSTISASHSDATFFNPKEHFQFLPIGAGSGYTCTYTTDDSEVAAVSEKGVVTAVGPGTTTVTMTVDGGGTEYIFKCIVRCKWTKDSQ